MIERFILTDVATIMQSKRGAKLVGLSIRNKDGKLFIMEVVPATSFKEYYCWEVSLDNLLLFKELKDNTKILPLKTSNIYRISVKDGKQLEVFKQNKYSASYMDASQASSFANNSMLTPITPKWEEGDDVLQEEIEQWECHDLALLERFIEEQVAQQKEQQEINKYSEN